MAQSAIGFGLVPQIKGLRGGVDRRWLAVREGNNDVGQRKRYKAIHVLHSGRGPSPLKCANQNQQPGRRTLWQEEEQRPDAEEQGDAKPSYKAPLDEPPPPAGSPPYFAYPPVGNPQYDYPQQYPPQQPYPPVGYPLYDYNPQQYPPQQPYPPVDNPQYDYNPQQYPPQQPYSSVDNPQYLPHQFYPPQGGYPPALKRSKWLRLKEKIRYLVRVLPDGIDALVDILNQ